MLPTIPVLEPPDIQSIAIVRPAEPQPPPTVEYVVKRGDTLTSISKAHTTTVQRVWAKNTELTDPDIITPSDPLKIPDASEVLPSRPFPATVSVTWEVPATPRTAPTTRAVSSSGLMGSMGYAKAGGNCVREPGVNSPHNGTNPISWAVLSRTPTIGATALFNFNHTGIVTGIWENGDIEIRHQNYSGGTHRFPRSDFRGFR